MHRVTQPALDLSPSWQPLVIEATARLAWDIPLLREAHVSPDGDEVLFVGDDWAPLSDRVSELLDAIGTAVDPTGTLFIRGGLRLCDPQLPTYARVPLRALLDHPMRPDQLQSARLWAGEILRRAGILTP
jgi:hypothetical protein